MPRPINDQDLVLRCDCGHESVIRIDLPIPWEKFTRLLNEKRVCVHALQGGVCNVKILTDEPARSEAVKRLTMAQEC